MTGTIRIYGAGGAGINIASQFQTRPEQTGYASPQPVYIDTSSSNIKNHIDKKDLYLLEATDGSGKIRKENANEIQNVIKNVLLEMKPLDLNVVVFSASGG
mgnify:CR=1 FL=1